MKGTWACDHLGSEFARYRTPPGGDPGGLVDLIARRVRQVSGPLGAVAVDRRPLWYSDRVPGKDNFVGRYREQWARFSLLHGYEFPLTQEVLRGPAMVLTGMYGIGKTSLAASYTWQFGAAHLGGVHWLSLAGSSADDARTAMSSRSA
jgi:hypothetical protein